MTEDIVGIDLGTTNSEIAIYQGGRPVVLADQQGRMILPSVVGVTEAGELLIGEEARNQLLLYPERTVRSIKRRMGRDETVRMAGDEYSPQEISAIILRRLKEIAAQRLGRPVSKAVITVPAYFSDTQRQATREAGEIAGLEVVRIINEPTAAALVYEAGARQGKRILVYDLGGGTFDVSVVRIEDEVVEVISSHGNNHLGGDDFDQKIVTHVIEHLKIKHGVDIADRPATMARILRAAEAAKRHLSDHPFARIEEEFITETEGRPVHLSLELSREDYEGMIMPFIEETLEAIHAALKGADLTASQVEEIVLVGGATRTPLVRRRLAEVFGLIPHGEVDADLCVAMGAAIQGAAVAGAEVSAVLVDVTPYTFGTSAVGEMDGEPYPYCFVPIIAKNTAIPVRKSDVFFTIIDQQSQVDIRIYQGESRDALENIKIGEFRVDGLSKAAAGNPVILDLALDRDGILHVAAREKVSGLEARIRIDQAVPRYGKADMQDAQARIGALFGAAEEAVSQSANADPADTALAALLAKAAAKLDEAGEEDRNEMVDLIEAIRDAAANNDMAALDQARRQLTDLLFYLET
jgi:molecular chaperone DnaK (HSP70)